MEASSTAPQRCAMYKYNTRMICARSSICIPLIADFKISSIAWLLRSFPCPCSLGSGGLTLTPASVTDARVLAAGGY
jgi:hypothetical protein